MDQKQTGLKTSTIWLMIGVALFFDVLQIAFSWIGVGFLMIPIEYGTFWLWFKFKGLNFFSMKRAQSLAIGAFLETITGGILPAFTLVVARITLTLKAKELVVNKTPAGRVVGSIAKHVDDKKMRKAA